MRKSEVRKEEEDVEEEGRSRVVLKLGSKESHMPTYLSSLRFKCLDILLHATAKVQCDVCPFRFLFFPVILCMVIVNEEGERERERGQTGALIHAFFMFVFWGEPFLPPARTTYISNDT